MIFPISSTTCSRPPICTAAVAMTLPFSTMPSLVVPPPISMLRMRLFSSCETRDAPERLAGEDDDAGVDVVGLHARRRIGLVDDGRERGIVDALVVVLGCGGH